MTDRRRQITIQGLPLVINKHVDKVMGVLENSSELCSDHAVSLFSTIASGIKLKIFSNENSMEDSSSSSLSQESNSADCNPTDSTGEVTPNHPGPLRVPTSEVHLRQLGDQMYGNRMRLLQTIQNPTSTPCIEEPCTSTSKAFFRLSPLKKISFSRRRARKNGVASDSPENADFDVGEFAKHIIAENCLGNLKVTGCNLEDKGKTRYTSHSFDSGLLSVAAAGGHQRYMRECLGSAMARHSLVPHSDNLRVQTNKNCRLNRSASFQY